MGKTAKNMEGSGTVLDNTLRAEACGQIEQELVPQDLDDLEALHLQILTFLVGLMPHHSVGWFPLH